jgi:hypothetical protein
MRDLTFGVYLRDDRVLVVPSAGGRDIDPVMIVAPIEAEVQRAVEAAIELSGKGPPPPDDSDLKNWSVLKALGLKSARAFLQNVARVGVLIYQGNIEVRPQDPTKRGQAFEQVRKSIAVPNIESLGRAVLEALKDSPRMNPKP